MAEAARIRTLEARHASLETRIVEEVGRPRPDELTVSRLKREKLRLKEEMQRLRPRSLH